MAARAVGTCPPPCCSKAPRPGSLRSLSGLAGGLAVLPPFRREPTPCASLHAWAPSCRGRFAHPPVSRPAAPPGASPPARTRPPNSPATTPGQLGRKRSRRWPVLCLGSQMGGLAGGSPRKAAALHPGSGDKSAFPPTWPNSLTLADGPGRLPLAGPASAGRPRVYALTNAALRKCFVISLWFCCVIWSDNHFRWSQLTTTRQSCWRYLLSGGRDERAVSSQFGHDRPLRLCPGSGHLCLLPGVRVIGVVIRTQPRLFPCPTGNPGDIMGAWISIHIRTQTARLISVRTHGPI